MTPEQYWHSSDPTEYWAYRQSFKLKKDYETESVNFQSWLQGSYIQLAVASILDDSGQTKYMDKPFDFKEAERKANMSDEEKLKEEQAKEEALIKAEMNRINRILSEQQRQKGGN